MTTFEWIKSLYQSKSLYKNGKKRHVIFLKNFKSLKINFSISFTHFFHNIIKRLNTKIRYARVKIFQKHKYVYPVGKFLSQTSRPTSGRIFFEYLVLNECKRKRLAPFDRATRYFNQRVTQLYEGREDVRTIDNRWCTDLEIGNKRMSTG